MSSSEIGMIGLAVMGANLARNIERNGFSCCVYNRTAAVTQNFIKDFGTSSFKAAYSLDEFVAALKTPRKIFIMIQAGDPVDAVLNSLIPLLSKGDIVIDGGNAFFRDTIRREEECRVKGIHFVGVGISGGEEGALNGPSLMPGGSRESWEYLSPIFKKIAAFVDRPCVTYIGPNGAGHFVKTVHNGIEYGDMQLIAESYDLLKRVGKFPPPQLSGIFSEWNQGILSSFLIEITGRIFKESDLDTGDYLIDKILDKAGQKGTGKWTIEAAAELGVSTPTLAAAVDARIISSQYQQRQLAGNEFKEITSEKIKIFQPDNLNDFVIQVHDALYVAKVICYAQGMDLLKKASQNLEWSLDFSEISAIWKGGCIIRAKLLKVIEDVYRTNPNLENLILAPVFKEHISQKIGALREIVSQAAKSGIAIPAFSSSLYYFEMYTTKRLPHNLTQAQRDLFGAHTYERVDKEGKFHTEW